MRIFTISKRKRLCGLYSVGAGYHNVTVSDMGDGVLALVARRSPGSGVNKWHISWEDIEATMTNDVNKINSAMLISVQERADDLDRLAKWNEASRGRV